MPSVSNLKPGGVTVKCQAKGCKLVAHPVCGFEHGWYLFLDLSANQDAHEADDGKRARRREEKGGKAKDEKALEVERLVFCQEHAPQEEDDDETLYCICQRRYFSSLNSCVPFMFLSVLKCSRVLAVCTYGL